MNSWNLDIIVFHDKNIPSASPSMFQYVTNKDTVYAEAPNASLRLYLNQVS